MEKLHPGLTIRFFTAEKCFGPGVAALLEGIRKEGSLRAAAGEMGMAYSKAWTILKTAERELGFPLVESAAGGRTGGGSRLTEKGESLLSRYREYCKKINAYAAELFAEAFPEF
ncbi:MAG: LysR family transcriptional regulator [Clostridia bacterium]|nr:LysR family transcriptional regulator [Clostridia bacterium]